MSRRVCTKKASNAATEEEKERKELAMTLMSKKKRKLYDSMQRGIQQKSLEKSRLAMKREKIASAAASATKKSPVNKTVAAKKTDAKK